MKISGMMACRNEDWILGFSARAALMWLDSLVIYEHASTDRSREIQAELMAEFPGRVDVITDDNPVWEEMRHRQTMLDRCRSLGASHVVYIDADEILTADLLQQIRRLIFELPPSNVLQLPLLCMRGPNNRVHVNGPWSDGQFVSLAFQDSPDMGWSNTGRDGYDFHHRHPMVNPPRPLYGYRPLTWRHSGVMHVQFMNDRRLRAKHAFYKMTEVTRWPGREPIAMVDQRYNLAIYGQYQTPEDGIPRLEASLGDGRAVWWEGYEDIRSFWNMDAVPWQEAECHKLVAKYGRDFFNGLNLFGIC